MLKRYNIFKSPDDSFQQRIHIACVTENDSIKALFVDDNDDVYALGKDYNDSQEPVRLDVISKLEVCDFSYGRGHVAALTKDGQVFMWGQNDRHQCGNGGKEYLNNPTQIHFQDEKVKSVQCGWDHTLALTESGSVYTWGRNMFAQCGNGLRSNVKFPEKLMIGKVKTMAVGAGHSMVLLDNGQVYGWGENGDGQLGLGRETHCELSPALISENLKRVKKIVCGSYHTIALSSDGCLYTWGYNDYGQLGLQHTERRQSPQKLESHAGGPYVDVAALWCKDLSVAQKENGKFYIWGQTSQGDWPMPTEIKVESFNHAFALHVLAIPVTYECVVFEISEKNASSQSQSIQCKIDEISFNSRNIIGRGVCGTLVFRGLYDNLSVAIKRTDLIEISEKEMDSLRSLDHQNLVRYYARRSDSMFSYIALERAEMSFADLIDHKRKGQFKDLNVVPLLADISNGLTYLHSRNIKHCNIRPQNALISEAMRPLGNRKAMLSDFNCFEEKNSRILRTLAVSLADCWVAPEVLVSDDSAFAATKSSDLFSLGCLFYYMLNDGQHPFGDSFHRQANLYDGRYDISALKRDNTVAEYHVIQAMIDSDISKRPTIEAVLKHPMFWDATKILAFLKSAHYRLKQEDKVSSPLVNSLETRSMAITGRNWMRMITSELQSDLKKYDDSKVYELIRAIRNKFEHYNDLTEGVRQELGQLPNGYVKYFTEKFPLLVPHAYFVFQPCKRENDFVEYYDHTYDFQQMPAI